MKRYISIAVHMLLASLIISACQKNELHNSGDSQERGSVYVTYCPQVGMMSDDAATKAELINPSGTSAMPLEEVVDTTDFFFYVSAWDIDGANTKRFIPDEENEAKFETVKFFHTNLTPAEEVEKSRVRRDTWNTYFLNPDEGNKPWIIEKTWKSKKQADGTYVGIEKAFYAYANLSGDKVPVVSIDGTTHEPTVMTLDFDEPEYAADQQDLLVAYYGGNGQDGTNPSGTARLLFHHPLASVQVKIGTIEGVNEFKINSVRIEGVHSGGELVMTPPSDAESDVTLEWTPKTGEGSIMTVSQEVNLSGAEAKTANTLVGVPFTVMPQSFSSAPARIGINVTADDRTFDIFWPLKSSSWAAGTIYTYTVKYDGHEGVQLWEDGPYWATKNVGADNIWDTGWYFSRANVVGFIPEDMKQRTGSQIYDGKWIAAETKTLLEDGFSNDDYFDSESIQGRGCSLEKDIIPGEYDAAYVNCSSKWRMPTKSEFELLLSNTDHDVVTRHGVIGFLFTGKDTYKDNSIFLPYCGEGGDNTLSKYFSAYWSSTYDSDNAQGYYLRTSYTLNSSGIVSSPLVSVGSLDRSFGACIRPVENTGYKKPEVETE